MGGEDFQGGAGLNERERRNLHVRVGQAGVCEDVENVRTAGMGKYR